MKYTPEQIGEMVRASRRGQGVTQKELAMASGTGLRFIIEMEKGKATCQIGKVLNVLHTLGITMTLIAPWTDEPPVARTGQTPSGKPPRP